MSSGSPVFAVGRLGYDFVGDARLDYFAQAIANWQQRQQHAPDPGPCADHTAPFQPMIMLSYLLDVDAGGTTSNLADAAALTWTLTVDGVPAYVIVPGLSTGLSWHRQLTDILWRQEVSSIAPTAAGPSMAAGQLMQARPTLERVAQAGCVDGDVRLFNGATVPRIVTAGRMQSWDMADLARPEAADRAMAFLAPIYRTLKNPGASPQDRALNYATFRACHTQQMLAPMFDRNMLFDTVTVDRSTGGAPDADCWTVTWSFLDPAQTHGDAGEAFQCTVDVSGVVPELVDGLRQRSVR